MDDPALAAETLLALVSGLSDGILLGHYSVARALVVLDGHLDTLQGRR